MIAAGKDVDWNDWGIFLLCHYAYTVACISLCFAALSCSFWEILALPYCVVACETVLIPSWIPRAKLHPWLCCGKPRIASPTWTAANTFCWNQAQQRWEFVAKITPRVTFNMFGVWSCSADFINVQISDHMVGTFLCKNKLFQKQFLFRHRYSCLLALRLVCVFCHKYKR